MPIAANHPLPCVRRWDESFQVAMPGWEPLASSSKHLNILKDERLEWYSTSRAGPSALRVHYEDLGDRRAPGSDWQFLLQIFLNVRTVEAWVQPRNQDQVQCFLSSTKKNK